MTHVKFIRRPNEKAFNSFVEDFFAEFPGFSKNDPAVTNWKGSVPVNIIETGSGYQLEVVVPGFEKNDFKVKLDRQLLTISAERNADNNSEAGKMIRSEYDFRSFKRSFTLNEFVDATKIEASYINGVLLLNLPKKEEVKEAAKEIEIK